MRETSERDTARRTVAFFASVIKSGEPWSAACQDAYDATFRPLSEETAPTLREFDCIASGLCEDGDPCCHEARVAAVDASAAQDQVWDKLLADGWQRVDKVDVDEAPLSSVAVGEPPAAGKGGDTLDASILGVATGGSRERPTDPPSVSVPREELDRARELFKQIGLQVQPKAETVLGSRCFELFSLLASWGTT